MKGNSVGGVVGLGCPMGSVGGLLVGLCVGWGWASCCLRRCPLARAGLCRRGCAVGWGVGHVRRRHRSGFRW